MMDPEFADRLREGTRRAYSAAASRPDDSHPFPVGRAFALSLGYPAGLLDELPAATEAFAGVSNVSIWAELPQGAVVLDLGCGAGLDSFIAASRVGQEGRVIGLDFSGDMLRRTRPASTQAGAGAPLFCQSDGERIPLADDSIDVALVNGIFNLNPARRAIFGELSRVIRPGGKVYAAELILRAPLPAEVQASEDNWFA